MRKSGELDIISALKEKACVPGQPLKVRKGGLQQRGSKTKVSSYYSHCRTKDPPLVQTPFGKLRNHLEADVGCWVPRRLL